MRVNEFGNRSFKRDAEDLDHLTEPRPRGGGAAATRQRSARPSPEAAARRGPRAVSDEPSLVEIDCATDDTTDEAPSRSIASALIAAAANARLLARLDNGAGESTTHTAESTPSFSPATPFPPSAPLLPAPSAQSATPAPTVAVNALVAETALTLDREFDSERVVDQGARRTFREHRQEVATPATSPTPPAASSAPAAAAFSSTMASSTAAASTKALANERPVEAA
jgi:hypothetical protein